MLLYQLMIMLATFRLRHNLPVMESAAVYETRNVGCVRH
jgi:hypothetical protein